MPLNSFLVGDELEEAIGYTNLYNIFKQYGSLGITVPYDRIDIDTLQILFDYDIAIQEFHENKMKSKSRGKR